MHRLAFEVEGRLAGTGPVQCRCRCACRFAVDHGAGAATDHRLRGPQGITVSIGGDLRGLSGLGGGCQVALALAVRRGHGAAADPQREGAGPG
ncbi:hypothetical protein G6F58_013778 [Rhizopus delemar]|nr:hypothetical protein G6F58_013778 [Rhizopus delemar]